jgi:predicted RNase H-like HicB family nuclease
MLDRIKGEYYYRGVSGGDSPLERHQKARSGLVQTVVPMTFSVVITPEEGGGFSAFSPDLSGARTQGETEDELIHNMAEAVELVLEARGTIVPFVLRLPDSK